MSMHDCPSCRCITPQQALKQAKAMDEATRRHKLMVEEWVERGHPPAPCTGHAYPLPDCPAPGVH